MEGLGLKDWMEKSLNFKLLVFQKWPKTQPDIYAMIFVRETT